MNTKAKLLLPVIQLFIIGSFIFMAMASGGSSNLAGSSYSSSSYSSSSNSSSSSSHTFSDPKLNSLCQKKRMKYYAQARAYNARECDDYCDRYKHGNSCWDQASQTCWCAN